MNASESYVNIAHGEAGDGCGKAGREPALGAAPECARHDRAGATTPYDQPDPSETTQQPNVEKEAEPLVVEDRGVAERVVSSSLSRAQTLPEERRAYAFAEPRPEVGPPTDESRVTSEGVGTRASRPPCGKKEFFTVAIDPGAAILTTISIGITSGSRRTTSRGRSHSE